jgi:nickel superoxide dismutase
MKKSLLSRCLAAVAVSLGLALSAQTLSAHCQVPCGIYHDSARVAAMLEDADTVIKAGKMLGELANESDAQSANQIVRWVTNKESHAQKVISTISDYFLTQRVKSSQDDYVQRLKDHHAVIVAAMKAKQSADPAAGMALKKAIAKLDAYYPHEHKH